MTETTKMIKAIANDSKVRIDRIVANYEQLEKENAELQNKVDTLQGFLDRDVEFDNLQKENADLKEEINKIAFARGNLEEENAELKEKVNILDNCDRLGDVITEAYKEQLTKAKELLKEFVQHYKAKTIYVENMQDLLKQTEQLLSEVEK